MLVFQNFAAWIALPFAKIRSCVVTAPSIFGQDIKCAGSCVSPHSYDVSDVSTRCIHAHIAILHQKPPHERASPAEEDLLPTSQLGDQLHICLGQIGGLILQNTGNMICQLINSYRDFCKEWWRQLWFADCATLQTHFVQTFPVVSNLVIWDVSNYEGDFISLHFILR